MERVYDQDEDDYILKSKDNTELKLVVPCWVFGEKIKNQIGLQTHMNKHWRENVVLNDNYNIKPSFNQRQLLLLTVLIVLSIPATNLYDPKDYILDEFRPFKSYKYKVTANCLYRKRNKDDEEEKTIKII